MIERGYGFRVGLTVDRDLPYFQANAVLATNWSVEIQSEHAGTSDGPSKSIFATNLTRKLSRRRWAVNWASMNGRSAVQFQARRMQRPRPHLSTKPNVALRVATFGQKNDIALTEVVYRFHRSAEDYDHRAAFSQWAGRPLLMQSLPKSLLTDFGAPASGLINQGVSRIATPEPNFGKGFPSIFLVGEIDPEVREIVRNYLRRQSEL